MRLISVVMGTSSENSRAAETQKLLAYGFRYYEDATLYTAGDELESARIWYGKSEYLSLSVARDVILTIPRGSRGSIEANLSLPETLEAPIAQGETVGTLTLTLNGEVLAEVPAVAVAAVEEAGFFARLIDSIKLFISNLLS